MMEWTSKLKAELMKTQGKEARLEKFRQKNCLEMKMESVSRSYRKFREDITERVDSFLAFLFRGRTKKEITIEFGLTEKQIVQRLDKGFDGYTLFTTRNTFQEEVFIFLPEPTDNLTIKPKIWNYQTADKDPYIWIQFPADMPFSKIKVVPLADVHFGAFGSKDKKFDEYINWIARTPNAFAFINGDLLEFAHGDTLRGIAVHEQKERPRTQIEEMLYKLAPIAHKILWAIPGNHEKRSRKYDFDPLEWICKRLEIPYFKRTVYTDILWNGYVFDFFCQHGTTSSQTKGGKLNAASRPLQFQEFTMFTVMAHVHDEMANKITRICRDRVNFKLAFKKQYIVICPSFFGYFGTYAEDAGFSPGSVGAVACELYKNGDYHASS